MSLLFKRLQKSNKNSDMQSWQQIEINNQILSRINYHLLKSKDMTMANSPAAIPRLLPRLLHSLLWTEYCLNKYSYHDSRLKQENGIVY